MFNDTKREELERDYDYTRDRLLGAMAKTLEVLLQAHLQAHPLRSPEEARSAHKTALLLGGLCTCIEHFSDAESKLREHRRG